MSAAVVVGLLDSGVASALGAPVRAVRALIEAPAPPDPLGHGSALARIILHHAPQVQLLDAQAFDARQRTTPAAVAAGLDWLRLQGAQIANLSFGLRQDRSVLREAVAAAEAAGMLLIAAVPARGGRVYPGGYPGVLRVTGDARCAPGELAALGGAPADYGACPHDLRGRPGGASFATAHITGLLARHLSTPARDPRALLGRLARFHGRERRRA